MNKIVKLLPGSTGDVCGYVLLKLISRTGLTYEFISFMLSYLIVPVRMESAMRNCGIKL